MTKRILLIVGLAAVAGGLLLASQWRRRPMKVSGFVEADEIRLGSRVGGRVLKVNVEEGDTVAKGQVLVELEPFDLVQRRREAEATLAAAEAVYDRLTAGFREEEIAQAKARQEQLQAAVERLVNGPREQEIAAASQLVKVAEAQQVLAQQNFDRTAELFRKGAVTQDDLDRATEQKKGADAMLAVRQEELALLEEGTRPEEIAEAKAKEREAAEAYQLKKNGYRKEDIQEARAARDAAAAALEAIDKQIEELRIVAPVEKATVESLDLQPGDMAAPGAPVMSLMDASHLWVRAYVPQDMLALKEEQPLRITVDAFPGRQFRGRVTFISRQAEFTPNNVQTPEERSKQVFRIKVAVTEGREELRPGMTADVWLKN